MFSSTFLLLFVPIGGIFLQFPKKERFSFSSPRRMKHTTQDRLAMLTETKHVRPICAACRRPERVCLCNSGCLPPNGPINIGNLCEILVLQHPAEAKKKANTVPLMELVIQNLRIVRGIRFDEALVDEIRTARDKRGLTPLLLFPGPNATSLRTVLENERQELSQETPGSYVETNKTAAIEDSSGNVLIKPRYLLILIDGTWIQAHHMLTHSHPDLFGRREEEDKMRLVATNLNDRERGDASAASLVMQVMFDTVETSGAFSPLQEEAERTRGLISNDTSCIFDALRKEPAPHCVSTLEAAARALRELSGGCEASLDVEVAEASSPGCAAAACLEATLRAMVAAQLQFVGCAPPRYINRKRRTLNRKLQSRDRTAAAS